MLGAIGGFVGELRDAGLPVSLTESSDAARAASLVGLGDRERLREALAATLVKRNDHRQAFDVAFDVWFCLRGRAPGEGTPPPEGRVPAGSPLPAGSPVPAGSLAARLDDALRTGDEALLAEVARRAVASLAAVDGGRRRGSGYYVQRTMRRLDADGALERLLGGAPGGDVDHLVRDTSLRRRLERLQRLVESEVLRRLVDAHGPEAVLDALRRPLPADVELLHATRQELDALRRALHPLARRMAARLARRRRQGGRGRLDMRRTLRASLSSGGVPVDVRFRRACPSKPEIMVLADVSGSVASFAGFTLRFLHALAGQFKRVRSFVFIDGVDEVTAIFEASADMGEAMERVNAEADVVWADGHSDYGHALEAFWSRWGAEVTPRTSLIVLGDARNNYHQANAWAVEALRSRARRLWWLNPEPRAYWDTGDSLVSVYAEHCDGVFECRTLRQLERFVAAVG